MRWPVVVLARSAFGARALMAEDAPPVAYVPSVRDLEQFVAAQDIRIVLYVNQNTRNFQMFRRSDEHTSELPSPMRKSYAVFSLQKQSNNTSTNTTILDTT